MCEFVHHMQQKPIVKAERTGEKAWFTAYIFFLLICMLIAVGLAGLGILLSLLSSGKIKWGDNMTKDKNSLEMAGIGFKVDANLATRLFLFLFSTVLTLVLVVGLCATRSSNRKLLSTHQCEREPTISIVYVVALRILIASCFILSIAAFVIEAPLREHLSVVLNAALEESEDQYIAIPSSQSVVELYQSTFGCCAYSGDYATGGSNGFITTCQARDVAEVRASSTVPLDFATESTLPADLDTMPNDVTTRSNENAISYPDDCLSAITNWLDVCAAALLLTGAMLAILHMTWCIWRKRAGFSVLCLDQAVKRSAVGPFEKAWSESFVFLGQATHRQSLQANDDRTELPLQASVIYHEPNEHETTLLIASDKKTARPNYDYQFTDTPSRESEASARQRNLPSNSFHPTDGVSTAHLARESAPEKGEQNSPTSSTRDSYNITEGQYQYSENLWAANVVLFDRPNSSADNPDTLSVYSVESIEW